MIPKGVIVIYPRKKKELFMYCRDSRTENNAVSIFKSKQQ
jgi:hypothetical protein